LKQGGDDIFYEHPIFGHQVGWEELFHFKVLYSKRVDEAKLLKLVANWEIALTNPPMLSKYEARDEDA
jgi:hypothetical protein